VNATGRTREEGRKTIESFIWVAAAYTALDLCHWFFKILFIEKNYCDFWRYYDAAGALLKGGAVYSHDVGYHPVFFLLVMPFRLLGSLWGPLAWGCFMMLMLVIFIKMVNEKKKTALAIPVTVFLCAVFAPVKEDLAVGQINLILLVCVFLGWFEKRLPMWLRGIAVAFVVACKVQFGFLGFVFLIRREFRMVAWSLVGYAILTMVVSVACGPGLMSAYVTKWLGFASMTAGVDRYTSFFSDIYTFFPCAYNAITKIFHANGVLFCKQAWACFSLVSVGCAAIVVLKSRQAMVNGGFSAEVALFALMTSLMLIITPFSEEHHMVLLLLVFVPFFTGQVFFEPKNRWLWCAAFLLCGLLYSLDSFSALLTGPASMLRMGKLVGVFMIFALSSHELVRIENKCVAAGDK